MPLTGGRFRVAIAVVFGQQSVDLPQERLGGGTNPPPELHHSVGANVIVRHAALQQRFAHLLEDVAQHGLDEVRRVLAEHRELLRTAELRHVGVALQHDPDVSPKLRGSRAHELVENRPRRQIHCDLLGKLTKLGPRAALYGIGLGRPPSVGGARITAPTTDQAGRLIPAERGQALRLRAPRADSPHLLAVDAGDQRDATVGLTPAGECEVLIRDLDYEFA